MLLRRGGSTALFTHELDVAIMKTLGDIRVVWAADNPLHEFGFDLRRAHVLSIERVHPCLPLSGSLA